VARIERSAYKGPWLPEPLISEPPPTPEQQAELASDVSTALLLVLERLAPEERAAFLLREVCDYDYESIGAILGKAAATCRQLVHRAQERVHRERPRFAVTAAARERLVDSFIAAVNAGDSQALTDLFAADATWTADGGGRARATTRTLHGAARITKLVLGFMRRYGNLRMHKVYFNGELGVLVAADHKPMTALSFLLDGSHIIAAYNVVNPDKLHDFSTVAL
jgi:RNA polymerase sigma-70 factor, ECF subfamily